jgi:capsule biosynthesis phosphatase
MLERERMLVIDVDGTIAGPPHGGDYSACDVRLDVVLRMRELKAAGWQIALHTSRNMQTHEANVGRITAQTLPVLIKWLNRHAVPYDEIHVGKPWPGREGFYVDDRAIRPSEFTSLSLSEIGDLLAREAGSPRTDATPIPSA